MLPVAWQLDDNITNICTGRFCQCDKQTPEEALIELCVRGTPINILSGPVRLFCYHRPMISHQKQFCLHDNVIVLEKDAIARIVGAVMARRVLGKVEGQSWVAKTLYRFPGLVVMFACKKASPIRNAMMELLQDKKRPYFLEGRLDLWWKLFERGIVSCNIFDSNWLQAQLNHTACLARPTSDMLGAAHQFTMWALYLEGKKNVPGWALSTAFKRAIRFEISLLGIPGLRKDHQTNFPVLPRELLHRISSDVLNE